LVILTTEYLLEFVNAIVLAKPDCLYFGYFYVHRLLPVLFQEKNQVADCTDPKKVHQKGSKVGKKNSCDLSGDWVVVKSLR